MKPALFALFVPLPAPSAAASGLPPVVPKTPDLATNAEALPTLAGPAKAIGRINRALRAADARRLKDMKELDCLTDAPDRGYWWEQSEEATLAGARFVSFLRHGNQSCGGRPPECSASAERLCRAARRSSFAISPSSRLHTCRLPGHCAFDDSNVCNGPIETADGQGAHLSRNSRNCRAASGHKPGVKRRAEPQN